MQVENTESVLFFIDLLIFAGRIPKLKRPQSLANYGLAETVSGTSIASPPRKTVKVTVWPISTLR